MKMDVDDLADLMGDMRIGKASKPPFRFFDLPFELRLRVYELILLLPHTIDLDPTNYRNIRRLLELFLVSHRMHDEASRVFYGRNTFRIFPIHGRFINHKRPLFTRLPARYRALMTKAELRLGPGWTKPPRGWIVDGRLGLVDARKLRVLKVFVEVDPASHDIFEGFRNGENFYTEFCQALLAALFSQVPSFAEVQFDAYPGIKKSSPLLQALVNLSKAQSKRITWGPQREWDKVVEVNLANVLEDLALG